MKDISIIGFGNFGKFIASILDKYFNIYIYDKKLNESNSSFNYNFVSIKEALSKEIIIIAIPVQFIEEFIKTNIQFINKNALFIDVCSVKKKPIELLERYLYKTNEIIGTHPLFGPNSAKDGIKGHRIVVSPVRSTMIESVINFLQEKLNLSVIIKTPEEHDREMAMVQGISHFIAKALNDIGIRDSEMKTVTFDYLFKMVDILKNDTKELFLTIENENPYALELREKLINKLIEINNNLKNHLI